MFDGEIIFYNGFNLLVDIIVACTVWFFTKRIISKNAYFQGMLETLEAIDEEEITKGPDGWVIPCDDGTHIHIDTNKTPANPGLFLVPEAD